MTNNKLTIEEVKLWILECKSVGIEQDIAKQLADVMRENEMLKKGLYKMLMRFYYDNGSLPEIKEAQVLLTDYQYKESDNG